LSTLIHKRVELARQGENPYVVCRVPSGWVVFADNQTVDANTLLLPDPVVPDLNSLSPDNRIRFLLDMTIVGDALLKITESHRINYSILGNGEPALHAFISPRYHSEPEKYRTKPLWAYANDGIRGRSFDSISDRPLMEKLALTIQDVLGEQ